MHNILIRSLIFWPESVSQTADGVWIIDSTVKMENIQGSFRFCELHQEFAKLGWPLAVDFSALLARIIEQFLENPDSYPFITQIHEILDPKLKRDAKASTTRNLRTKGGQTAKFSLTPTTEVQTEFTPVG